MMERMETIRDMAFATGSFTISAESTRTEGLCWNLSVSPSQRLSSHHAVTRSSHYPRRTLLSWDCLNSRVSSGTRRFQSSPSVLSCQPFYSLQRRRFSKKYAALHSTSGSFLGSRLRNRDLDRASFSFSTCTFPHQVLNLALATPGVVRRAFITAAAILITSSAIAFQTTWLGPALSGALSKAMGLLNMALAKLVSDFSVFVNVGALVTAWVAFSSRQQVLRPDVSLSGPADNFRSASDSSLKPPFKHHSNHQQQQQHHNSPLKPSSSSSSHQHHVQAESPHHPHHNSPLPSPPSSTHQSHIPIQTPSLAASHVNNTTSSAPPISPSTSAPSPLPDGLVILAQERTVKASSHAKTYIFKDGKVQVIESHDDRTFVERISTMLRSMFFPLGFPDSVSSDYLPFTAWQFVQNFAASAAAVLATQGLLRAVGLGAGKAIPAAATLNWVLKDGMGKIGAMLFGSIFGNCFDNDPKRWRLAGDLVYDIGLGLEILSPLAPSLFLFTASLANAAKTISYMIRLPPRAAILRSFAGRENLGDISAKYNSQEVAANLCGMSVGIALSAVIGTSTLNAFVAYACLSSLHLFANYRSLRTLKLPTLNWNRIELLVKNFVEGGRVLPPHLVNKMERILSWPSSGHESSNIVFGARFDEIVKTPEDAMHLLRIYKTEKYIVTYKDNGKIYAVIREDAETPDVLLCLLQVGRLQAQLGGFPHMRNTCSEELRAGNANDVLAETYAFATNNFYSFHHGLSMQGWSTAHLLFEPQYRVRWDPLGIMKSLTASRRKYLAEHAGDKPSDVSDIEKGRAARQLQKNTEARSSTTTTTTIVDSSITEQR
mmetsp:Transcript_15595/g.25832  ORF Transcript_15595/g.25832 Transcript_15595/m.25832 type:complete len:830 (-) Transcript_15595:544-3033(-)